MKIKFKIGKAPMFSMIYIIPTLYITWNFDRFDEYKRTSIEFQWLFFGLGVLLQWKNKSVQKYPEYPDDMGMFLI